MTQQSLLNLFLQFAVAGMLGFLIGLEREMSRASSSSMGGRDFVLFALTGATSAFAALQYQLIWLIPGGFLAMLVLVVSRYWKDDDQGPGITSEVAAMLTFVLGVLVMHGAREIAIALTIVTLALLAFKREIKSLRFRVKSQDFQAVLKFLVITFIVLPVLPRESLDNYLELEVGRVETVDVSGREITIRVLKDRALATGDLVSIIPDSGKPVRGLRILRTTSDGAVGELPDGERTDIATGAGVHASLGIELVHVMLSAIKPYTLWLIVILVSLISFVGYVLIKLMGSGVGVGLTGLVGGLVSSTVTTLSFSRRSLERPELNRSVSIAILLASSMMFPRLLVEMYVVNPELAGSVAVPLMLTGAAGFGVALLLFSRSKRSAEESKPVEFDNPFSLTAAVNFGLVFAAILMLTRTATHYLGDAWLPVVAVISGLTDADAIAFSLSDAHRSDWISLRWASFNLVLGAISNTLMKLGLVLVLADRGLFRMLTIPFAILTAVGMGSAFFQYFAFPPNPA